VTEFLRKALCDFPRADPLEHPWERLGTCDIGVSVEGGGGKALQASETAKGTSRMQIEPLEGEVSRAHANRSRPSKCQAWACACQAAGRDLSVGFLGAFSGSISE
jgi:hypothetical protein